MKRNLFVLVIIIIAMLLLASCSTEQNLDCKRNCAEMKKTKKKCTSCTGCPKNPKGKRLTSSWFFYDKDHGIEKLAPFADITSSVSIAYSPAMNDTLAGFVKQCQELGIETYKIVGGKASAIDTPQAAQATIEGYIKDIHKFGFDGIDLDFEHLDPNVQDSYSVFLRDLSARLRKMGKKLSHCVGYYPQMYKKPPEKFFYDPKVINETCDLVRVMCYDLYYAGPEGTGMGPTCTKPWVKETMKFWLKYVDRKKLLMALPAYSNDYDITSAAKGRQIYGHSSPATPKDAQHVEYTWLHNAPTVKEGTEVERYWLYYECVNLYRYIDDKDHTHLFFASDADSTAALLEVAAELKIPYTGFWCRRYVTPEMWKAVRNWHDKGHRSECSRDGKCKK